MEEKNAVDLWDLPEDKVYVKIKDDVRYEFFKFIKNNYGGAKKLSQLANSRIENSYIYNWKYGIRFCPLMILNKLLSLMDINLKLYYKKLISSNIEKIKTPSNIEFPIKLSASLARIAGNLVGDGGLASEDEDRYRVYYTNKSSILIRKFKREVLNTFPDIKIQEYIDKRWNVIKLKLPRIAGVILSIFFGFQNNKLKHVPDSIKNSSIEIKAAFLGALFDDEASFHMKGGKIQLEMTAKNVVSDIKNILEKDFKIKVSEIKEYGPRTQNRQKTYRFHITGIDNFQRFSSGIPIFHNTKLISLELLRIDKRTVEFRNSQENEL